MPWVRKRGGGSHLMGNCRFCKAFIPVHTLRDHVMVNHPECREIIKNLDRDSEEKWKNLDGTRSRK
jgi:hypothetical protein